MSAPAGYTKLGLVGLTDKGPYVNNDNYVENDLVHHGGSVWRCKVNNTTGVTPTEGVYWTIWLGEPTNLVERIIAPLEESPSTQAYAVGKQLIFNDNLYEVIKPIAVNDALVTYESDPTNGNIKLAPPVETQLLAIKAEADATDDMIAPTETNASSSSRPYATGEQLILNNILYTLTQPVAQNGALITSGAGQNLTPSDSLTDQIAGKANATAVNTALAGKADREDIAPVEDGSTIQKAGGYAVGEQFYHEGTLCKALDTIAYGTAWTSLALNTDYEAADNITDQIGANSDQIEDLKDKVDGIIQESVFTVEESGGIFYLYWHGAAAICPFSVSQSGTDYNLIFTYNT